MHNKTDIEAAVATLALEPDGGLIVAADAFNAANGALIMTSVEQQRLPAIYYLRQAIAEAAWCHTDPTQPTSSDVRHRMSIASSRGRTPPIVQFSSLLSSSSLLTSRRRKRSV